MTSDKIRAEFSEAVVSHLNGAGLDGVQALLLVEIAAQLAELNEKLRGQCSAIAADVAGLRAHQVMTAHWACTGDLCHPDERERCGEVVPAGYTGIVFFPSGGSEEPGGCSRKKGHLGHHNICNARGHGRTYW